MLRIIVLATAICISGCATRPAHNSKVLSGVRLSTTKWLTQEPGSGTLVIRRDAGNMNGLCQMRVAIDAEKVGDLLPKEEIRLFPPPGEYIVEASLYGMCGGGVAEQKAVVLSGQQETIRIAGGQFGDLRIQNSSANH
jgi:hypothetical protein